MPATRKIRMIMELRSGGVSDASVLKAIEQVPRVEFVPDIFKDRAYENSALPIGEGQTISQPLVVGLMSQALELTKKHKVLEIGTGSGYQAAILAKLCRRVYTIERVKPLLVEAEARFAKLHIRNITTRAGDGNKGWPEQAPFDRIIVTAAAETIPPTLVDQLAVGGIMIVPVGQHGGVQVLTRVHKTEQGPVAEEMTGVRFVPMLPGEVG